MTRTENDLRAALRDLEQRADQHGAPSTAGILDDTTGDRLGGSRGSGAHHFRRWLAPIAAAAVVTATAVTAVTLASDDHGSSSPNRLQAGGNPTANHSRAHHPAPRTNPPSPTRKATAAVASPATILADAAAALDAAPWQPPAAQDFFYVRSTDATTWTSVSGKQAGDGHTADGSKVWVPGCAHGQLVSGGESGSCTLNDVPHYLSDAPTQPAGWDAYLEQLAPGAKAANAQGKFVVEVLHQDLVKPKAAAALLRYTSTDCPGLHTLAVRPVANEKLIGVTCTSMTNGSYGLVFDAATHHFVGFVGVSGKGAQASPAELIRQTGIVPAIGRTP